MLFLLLEQIPLAWDALKADLISAGTAGKPPLAEGTPVLPPCCSGAGMLSVVGTFSLVKRQGKELEIMTSPTTPAPRAVFIHQDLFVCSSSGGARLLFAGSRQERVFWELLAAAFPALLGAGIWGKKTQRGHPVLTQAEEHGLGMGFDPRLSQLCALPLALMELGMLAAWCGDRIPWPGVGAGQERGKNPPCLTGGGMLRWEEAAPVK